MKIVRPLVAVALLVFATQANAWFFIFIPLGAIKKVGEMISGVEPKDCIATTAKVGDVLTSPSGNTATVKYISGESARCKEPKKPVLAQLVYDFHFSSKAGMDVPDGYHEEELTDGQRYLGNLLHGVNAETHGSFFVSARRRDANTNTVLVAEAMASRMKTTLEEAETSDEEEITVNGLHAYRFRVVGKTKTMFRPSFTYVITVIEANDELVAVNAWSPSSNFESNRPVLEQLAYRISGIEPAPPEHTAERGDERPASAAPSAVPVVD